MIYIIKKRGAKRKITLYLGLAGFQRSLGKALGFRAREEAERIKESYSLNGISVDIEELFLPLNT